MHRDVGVMDAMTIEIDTPGLAELGAEKAKRIGVSQRSAQLLQVLTLKGEGGAKLFVKSVGGNERVRVWQSHHHH